MKERIRQALLHLIYLAGYVTGFVSGKLRQLAWRLRWKPLGVCGFSHFVKIGKSQGQDFYRVFHCYRDAHMRLPNGQLRCETHEVFPADIFDRAEFQ